MSAASAKLDKTAAGTSAGLLEFGRIFSALMDASTYALLIIDAKGRFLEANQEACRQLGYRKDELFRKRIFDIVGRDRVQNAKRALKHMASECGFRQSSHRRKDGSEYPVEVALQNIVFKGKNALLGIVKDISKEKLDQDARAWREARLSAIIENCPIYIFMYEKGRIFYANKATRAALGGSSPDKLIGLPAISLIRREDRPLIRERMRKTLTGPVKLPVAHVKMLGLDGAVRDVAAQSFCTWEGGRGRTTVFGMDTSALKNAENLLKESERLYKLLAESIPDYIYLLDRQGRVIYRNRDLPTFRGDPLGKRQDEIFPPEAVKTT